MILATKEARLRDLALAAEVSAATVSRFLNGSFKVPPATTKRIELAVAWDALGVPLGWRRN
jgi:transcriptional regulator with XRE-family HTH domain